MITAYPKPIYNADKLAAAGYLTKPIHPERLLAAVADWCPPGDPAPSSGF